MFTANLTDRQRELLGIAHLLSALEAKGVASHLNYDTRTKLRATLDTNRMEMLKIRAQLRAEVDQLTEGGLKKYAAV
jgi:hypothetical protein